MAHSVGWHLRMSRSQKIERYMFRLKNERQNSRCQNSNWFKNNAASFHWTFAIQTNAYCDYCCQNKYTFRFVLIEWHRPLCVQNKNETEDYVSAYWNCGLIHQSNALAIEVAVRGPFNASRHQTRWLIFGIKSIKNQFQQIKPLKRRVNGFANRPYFRWQHRISNWVHWLLYGEIRVCRFIFNSNQFWHFNFSFILAIHINGQTNWGLCASIWPQPNLTIYEYELIGKLMSLNCRAIKYANSRECHHSKS